MIKDVLCCTGRGAELMMWWVSSLSIINNPQHASSKSSLCLRSLTVISAILSLGQGSVFSQTLLFCWGKSIFFFFCFYHHYKFLSGQTSCLSSWLSVGQERTFCIKINFMWMILFIVLISDYSNLPYPEILRELNMKRWKPYPFPHAESNFAGFIFYFYFLVLAISYLAFPNTHSLAHDACSGYHTNDTLSFGKKLHKVRLDSETCSPATARSLLKVSYRSRARRSLLINSL